MTWDEVADWALRHCGPRGCGEAPNRVFLNATPVARVFTVPLLNVLDTAHPAIASLILVPASDSFHQLWMQLSSPGWKEVGRDRQ